MKYSDTLPYRLARSSVFGCISKCCALKVSAVENCSLISPSLGLPKG